MKKTICELFAGVGGFRLGFDRLNSGWKTVWFSQWEPSKKTQWAHACYVKHFGDCKDVNGEYHTGDDICSVKKLTIPDHTLLVGGFPCQDYSVASTLATSKGIEGKKGVLWWQIRDVLVTKRPPFCLFENVDRLLKSPAKQRGRDFGIILSCLHCLGYCAEWRVVNAASYGAAQRRKRVFIFAYRNDTQYRKNMNDPITTVIRSGLLAKAFPVEIAEGLYMTTVSTNTAEVSADFSFSDFSNAGVMVDGKVYSQKVYERETTPRLLRDILQEDVDEKYYVLDNAILKWERMKGAKKILRSTSDGHEYWYHEGAMPFPDDINKPGRTMLTSEATATRTSHIIKDPHTGRMRVLTPVEAERLNGFDDGWTAGMSDRMRYFCMGNALVVPMITRIGKVLDGIIENEI